MQQPSNWIPVDNRANRYEKIKPQWSMERESLKDNKKDLDIEICWKS